MNMLEALTQAGGAQAISRDLGVDQQTAQTGMAALLPMVLGGMQNHAGGAQGLGGLAGMLGGLGGGGLMDNVLAPQPTDVSQGNQVLGQIFGNKDASRTVATHAAQQSGLSPDLLKKMLPIVAMLAAGYFARQAGGQDGAIGGGAGDGLGGMLGGLLGGGGGGANPLNSILGGLMGARR
ncbi:DUF937 domain-containing protein [Sphingomonas sp. GCM10030256]|uniref:DUF937 domain-containing protein n=1 Tax=Sphingomonas sp. GCM10030256 TaxID=3273427 RepID=UPI00360D2AAA